VSWLFLPEFTKDAEKQNFTNLYVSCHVLHMLNGSPNRGLSDLGVAGRLWFQNVPNCLERE
jgi:hypothetical protein